MKYAIFPLVIFFVFILGEPCAAWDGFNAQTSELVEIIPDTIPATGSTIDVRSYDTDTTQTCLVENVTRNPRTIEVSVRTPGGAHQTLVMEGR